MYQIVIVVVLVVTLVVIYSDQAQLAVQKTRIRLDGPPKVRLKNNELVNTDSYPGTIITLTSLPTRYSNLMSTIQSILPQLKSSNDIVMINVGSQEYKRRIENNIRGPVVVRLTQDIGPATKFVHTLDDLERSDSPKNMLVCDDDHIYPDTWLEDFLRENIEKKGKAAICLSSLMPSSNFTSRYDPWEPEFSKKNKENMRAIIADSLFPDDLITLVPQGYTGYFIPSGAIKSKSVGIKDLFRVFSDAIPSEIKAKIGSVRKGLLPHMCEDDTLAASYLHINSIPLYNVPMSNKPTETHVTGSSVQKSQDRYRDTFGREYRYEIYPHLISFGLVPVCLVCHDNHNGECMHNQLNPISTLLHGINKKVSMVYPNKTARVSRTKRFRDPRDEGLRPIFHSVFLGDRGPIILISDI